MLKKKIFWDYYSLDTVNHLFIVLISTRVFVYLIQISFMKIFLLFILGIITFNAAIAQKINNPYLKKIPGHLVNRTARKVEKNFDFTPGFMLQTAIDNPQNILSISNSKITTPTETVVGYTYYDLQTNASVGNRLVVNADGTMGAVWTMEVLDPDTTYPNRGTGYNYFDGNNWGSIPTARIESSRTGWGEIAHTATGKEIVLSHGIAGGKLDAVTRPVKGTGVWTENINAIPTSTTSGSYFPKIVASGNGDTLFAISLTTPVANGGSLFHGLDGAVVFHRSVNGGITWDITNIIPTGIDSSKFRGFEPDEYAIDARKNIVAIVVGGADKDVVMVKSFDAGLTWTSTTLFDLPIDKWDHTTTTSDYNNDNIIDTIDTNDGSLSIAIDQNNIVHIAFGAMRIIQQSVETTQTWDYFPFTDGIFYWNEWKGLSTFPNQKPVVVAGIQDWGQPNVIYFPTPADPNKLPFGTYGVSLSSFPNLKKETGLSISLSYSSIVDSLVSVTDPEKSLRHQFITGSCDYNYWPSQIDLNGVNEPFEGVYGSLFIQNNANYYILYQRDLYPGHGVNSIVDSDNQGNLNEIVLQKIPILGGHFCSVGEKENLFEKNNLYLFPNPATNKAVIEISIETINSINVVLINNIGQEIYSNSFNGKSGHNKLNLDLNDLSSGIYFCKVKVGSEQVITKKLVISK